jgi:hypothetical protein
MGFVVLAALAAGVVAGTVLIGWRAHALRRVAVAALAATIVLWVVGWVFAAQGWRDIDGWIDCHPNCTTWHQVGAVWFLLPPLVAIGFVPVLRWVAVRGPSAQQPTDESPRSIVTRTRRRSRPAVTSSG